jgi:hypothetical protein
MTLRSAATIDTDEATSGDPAPAHKKSSAAHWLSDIPHVATTPSPADPTSASHDMPDLPDLRIAHKTTAGDQQLGLVAGLEGG